MWDRYLWGVELTKRDGTVVLIGDVWGGCTYVATNAPARPLLFYTKKQCREWCQSRRDAAKEAGWKFTPVKVRETVVKV